MASQKGADEQGISSEEILDRIANGESIDYDGITVLGDLDLSDLSLVKKLKERHLLVCLPVIISTIRITNSRIEGALTMDRAIFEEDVDFTGTRFAGPVSLTEARLKGYVSFNGSQFEDAANFGRCRFDQFADFSGAAFLADAYFVESIFNEDSNFRGTRFGRDAYFGGAIMQKYADFSESSFQSYASFRGARFQGYAYFSESQFSGDASFSGTAFESDASFMVAKFESDAFFTGARFKGYLSLMRSRFKEIADFSKSKFESEIYLTEARLSSVKLDWNSVKGRTVCDGATYLQLVRIFKDQEQFQEADDCYCEYRDKSRGTKSWADGSKYLDYVAYFTCGYGIRPINTIYMSITLILTFAGILWLGGQGFSPLDSIYYSALAFVADPKGPGLPGWYKHLFMTERLLGWLLMALFLVTLGRVMIR
ncbi:MAG: pentapeptide repeat-containing protein [Methanotrichaceae archaeon]|nr:pentapeptide repeat-containing protein [Methanotrichaceae archaeon]